MAGALTILAVEPWFGGSHRSALEGLASHSRHRFELATLPARHWKWRMQAAHVPLARRVRRLIADGLMPDVVLASSMLNLPAFVGLLARELTAVPAVLYMHENQITYPSQSGEEADLTYGFLSYVSCLAADAVVFNSDFHREEFLAALPQFLGRFPEPAAVSDEANSIRDFSSVLALGIDGARIDGLSAGEGDRKKDSPLTILWNHRWEHDKNPEAFFGAVDRLEAAGCEFELVVLGRQYSSRPEVFDNAGVRHRHRLRQFGYVGSFEEYCAWLRRSDVVVSTALHEFFGIAVLEAVRCGCHPLLPNRLSYPEIVSSLGPLPCGHAPVLYDSDDELADVLARLARRESLPIPRDELRAAAARYDWSVRAAEFDVMLSRVAARGPRSRPKN